MRFLREIVLAGIGLCCSAGCYSQEKVAFSDAVPPPVQGRAEEATWELVYENASRQEIDATIDFLWKALCDSTKDYFDQEFDAGRYTLVTVRDTAQPYALEEDANGDLCSWRLLADGRVLKVALPQDEFPETYALQRELEWLSSRRFPGPPSAEGAPEPTAHEH